MPIRPSGLARAIECPASVWLVDDGTPTDPNRYQAECDRGTEIHAWWQSLTTDTPLPPPTRPELQHVWLLEAERMDPGGYAELHFLLYEKDGQPLVLQGDDPEADAPQVDGGTLILRGSADRAGRGLDGKSPWVEDLKTGRRLVSPRSWQHRGYGLGVWVLVGRPSSGVVTSTLTWPRDLNREGQASRKHARLTPGDLYTTWQTILATKARVEAREPPTPNPECGLCSVASSCPALNRAPF